MERLDIYLKKNNYFETRNKARQEIEKGNVLVNDKVITKASFLVDENDKVEITDNINVYVSRGALKLKKALDEFSIDVKDKVVLDIGASTGGFTDVCLKKGVKRVYAVDVGEGQLHQSLVNDKRVINIEKTNFKDVNIKEYQEYNIDLIVCDVSFISITKMFKNISLLMNENTDFIGLIKPQFECEKKFHSKNGLVKDKKVHLSILNRIQSEANNEGLYIQNLILSPIRGEKSGNVEYLAWFKTFKNKISSAKIVNLIDKIS